MLNHTLANITGGKAGVEIGGPSNDTGRHVYPLVGSMDNVVYSKHTIWNSAGDTYEYYPGRSGKVIVNDAVNISNVGDEAYDFCFSSHCLEHIANPLKAVKEWLRIVKTGGHMIIIVPEKTMCFDHRRNVTPFKTLLTQYERDVGEEDLASLPEILRNHDLSMDIPAGNFEQFTRRSLDNFQNRCLHHHVYSPDLLKEICAYFKCQYVYTMTEGIHIWFVLKKV